jgi:hypothetical protein
LRKKRDVSFDGGYSMLIMKSPRSQESKNAGPKANHWSIGERIKSQLQKLQTVNAEFQASMESVQQPRSLSIIYLDFPTPPEDPASPDHHHWNIGVGIGVLLSAYFFSLNFQDGQHLGHQPF